ncbi:hypothetical protein ACKKBF_B08640 [Auxenochlorella protothecoides x Auxenochlorella symbiontica]
MLRGGGIFTPASRGAKQWFTCNDSSLEDSSTCSLPVPQAIKLFDELAASPRHSIRYQLQPGDIQLLSNHTVLHARSAFVDDAEDPNLRRHLLRLWLAPPDEFPLPEAYADILGGSVEVGKRGGIVVSGTRLNIPLEAE